MEILRWTELLLMHLAISFVWKENGSRLEYNGMITVIKIL